MPKGKTVVLADKNPRGRQLVVELPDEVEEATDDAELLRVVKELQGVEDASIRIDRQGEHGRDLTYIDDVPPENFTLKMLKFPPYNGGKFRIRPRRSDGTFAKNVVVKVEPAPKPFEPPALPTPGVPSISSDILARAMVEGFGRIGDAMARLGELIVSNRAAPVEQKGLRDLLGDVTALKELIAPVNQADPLAMLQSLLGIVKELPLGSGDGERGGSKTEMDVLYSLAERFMPKIIAASESATETPPQRIALPPGARPVLVRPSQPPAGAQPVNTQAMMLSFLVDQARRNNNPEPYAVMVLDNVPAALVDQYIHDADWFKKLCEAFPGAAPHEAWFGQLREHMVEYLTNAERQEHTGGDPVQGVPSGDAPSPGS